MMIRKSLIRGFNAHPTAFHQLVDFAVDPKFYAFFRAGMVETWGRGIGGIVRACRSAGRAKPQWVVEPGELRPKFVNTGAGLAPRPRGTAAETNQEKRGTADEMSRGDRPRPES